MFIFDNNFNLLRCPSEKKRRPLKWLRIFCTEDPGSIALTSVATATEYQCCEFQKLQNGFS